ncbi:Rubredoxin [Carex littledalei]|uniref:Rubredoxin n=1 Tax=Carex littledalei TaxID=544730 RepID=A0A833RGX0_9POAL|nr:Rubredoxin [Carex littledalei]
MALHAPPVGLKRSFPSLVRQQTNPRNTTDRYALQSSFLSPSVQLLVSPPQQSRVKPATQLKVVARVASKQAYICRDCGYIYNERTPFEKLPDKYFCPVCGAPKRRFRSYEPKVTKDANDTTLRKARKEQLKRDETIGRALPVAVVLGLAGLAGLYFYLNNAY